MTRRAVAALGLLFGGPHLESFYAPTFDTAIIELAHGSDPVRDGLDVGFGFDRLLLNGKLIEMSTGKDAAPPVAGTVQLYGLPTGQVAARTKSGEVHLSLGKDKPFTKVASGVERILYDKKTFLLYTKIGVKRLYGKVSETLDGGASWREIEPPPGGADGAEMRCFETGCTVGPWHRLGWSH